MTEEEAKAWCADRFTPEQVNALQTLADQVAAETERQNLIAPSTVPSMWARHMVDSAQLIALAPARGVWLDIGTGAGFPGLVVAIVRDEPILLVEPRGRRAAFLRHVVDLLGLRNASVVAAKVEQVRRPAMIISARAVAPVEKLLHAAAGCATIDTCWLLPRGQIAGGELASLRQRWTGMFHMKQSLTDPASTILVCHGVQPR